MKLHSLRFNSRPFCNASTEVLSQMMTDDDMMQDSKTAEKNSA